MYPSADKPVHSKISDITQLEMKCKHTTDLFAGFKLNQTRIARWVTPFPNLFNVDDAVMVQARKPGWLTERCTLTVSPEINVPVSTQEVQIIVKNSLVHETVEVNPKTVDFRNVRWREPEE